MKVVINNCYGGFSLSHKAFLRLRELGCQAALEEADYGEYWEGNSGEKRKKNEWDKGGSFCRGIPRNDPFLIKVIEELGEEANGEYACLAIIEIPDDVQWTVEEYDGNEHIAEVHRTWY